MRDPQNIDHISKVSSLLSEDVQGYSEDTGSQDADYVKTASTLEKLGRALASGQVKIDDDLRDLFVGDSTDDELVQRNAIEDEYDKVNGGAQ